jgi:hypothetical protein
VATATKEKAATATDELVLFLAAEGEAPLADALARCGEAALALAWARGEVEFGRTKMVTTGNPLTAVTVHNGVHLPAPTLVVEGGVEWSGPKQRHHAPFQKFKDDRLPQYPRYQKYQLEVCVNKEKDVWEWLEAGDAADGRETRYARRDVKRAEAEALVVTLVRLTEKGAAALA